MRVQLDASGMGKCPKCGVRVQGAAGETAAREVANPADFRRRLQNTEVKTVPVPRGAASNVESAMEPSSRVDITPPPGKFVFIRADGKAAEIRDVPVAALKETRGASTLFVALAALVVGAVACHLMERFGGHQMWVVKRAAVAWVVGMMSAWGMMTSSRRRGRGVAMWVACGAVLGAKLLAWPVLSLGVIDLLMVALAAGGCECAFVLGEDGRAKDDSRGRDFRIVRAA